MHYPLIPTATGWGYPSRSLINNFWYKLPSTIINYHQHTAITINYLEKLPSTWPKWDFKLPSTCEILFRLQYGKYGYNWFNLGSKSRSKYPSISCTSFTSREDLEIEISSIVVPYRSTPPPFFVDGNCVDGNWLPTVILTLHCTHIYSICAYSPSKPVWILEIEANVRQI